MGLRQSGMAPIPWQHISHSLRGCPMPRVFGTLLAFTSLLHQTLVKLILPWTFSWMGWKKRRTNVVCCLNSWSCYKLRIKIISLVVNSQEVFISSAGWVPPHTACSAAKGTVHETWTEQLRVEEKREVLAVPGLLEDELRRVLQEICCCIHPQAIVPLYLFNTENVSNVWSFPDRHRKLLQRYPDTL